MIESSFIHLVKLGMVVYQQDAPIVNTFRMLLFSTEQNHDLADGFRKDAPGGIEQREDIL